jgi:hypothetical protein
VAAGTGGGAAAGLSALGKGGSGGGASVLPGGLPGGVVIDDPWVIARSRDRHLRYS